MHEPIAVPLLAYRFASILFQINFSQRYLASLCLSLSIRSKQQSCKCCITKICRFICWRRKHFGCACLTTFDGYVHTTNNWFMVFRLKSGNEKKKKEEKKNARRLRFYNSIWRVLIEWETAKKRAAVDLNIDENDWFDLILCRLCFIIQSNYRSASNWTASDICVHFVFGNLAPCFAIQKFNQQEIRIISASLRTHT